MKCRIFSISRQRSSRRKKSTRSILPAPRFSPPSTNAPSIRSRLIIGQDPYHNPGQANGLCFSVSDGIEPPPSLVNIFQELHDDLGIPILQSGNLENWAHQGILLLNSSLTVRAHQAASHSGIGWQQFTDTIIERISAIKENLVFLLWGNYAIRKKALIAQDRGHLILEAPHPSPLSAYRGFFGCRHFSKANAFLKSKGLEEINWTP